MTSFHILFKREFDTILPYMNKNLVKRSHFHHIQYGLNQTLIAKTISLKGCITITYLILRVKRNHIISFLSNKNLKRLKSWNGFQLWHHIISFLSNKNLSKSRNPNTACHIAISYNELSYSNYYKKHTHFYNNKWLWFKQSHQITIYSRILAFKTKQANPNTLPKSTYF